MRLLHYTVPFLLTLILVSSCTKISDLLHPPSPKERYVREFSDDKPSLTQWIDEYNQSLSDSLKMALPYSESGFFVTGSPDVYSYDVNLRLGEIFYLNILTDGNDKRVFVDLLRQGADSTSRFYPIYQADLTDIPLQYTVEETGIYRVVIQPAMGINSPFALTAYSLPSYQFPVVNHDNNAILSFWGAPRDAGRRSHEGIDIFAQRGTPVVAAADGRIRYSGERGLGGKQVWLRTSRFSGRSLYYAHLDSINVIQSEQVSRGDTIGFVGNSGNAITTNPHLHFGIYSRKGAVDPLPFVYIVEPTPMPELPDVESVTLQNGIPILTVDSPVANLRQAASIQSSVIGHVQQGDTLRFFGSAGNWKHIKTASGQRATIHESLVK